MVEFSCTGTCDIETGDVELGMRKVKGNALELAMVLVAFVTEMDEEYHCGGSLRRVVAVGLKKEVDD